MGIKQTITQLQNNVRQNTVIGGGNQLATKTSGGIVMGSKVSLDTFENKNLPTLWSLKTAPGQQFVHRDKSGREYPAIYIYTGVNPNVALESVHLKNPWIADGVHPGYFSFGYFDTLRDDDPATYSRQSGQYFNATWQTAESIHNCVTRVASKRLDGWVELPIAAKSVRVMYAVAYLGFGLVPTLGFFAVPYDLDETDVTLPAGLSGVGSLSFKPDFSRFHDAAAIDPDCFHGIIGAPKLIYGQTPYTDSMEPFVDMAASGYIASGDGLQWQMYSAGAAMEFTDATDTNEYTFRPVMLGGKSNSQVIGDGDLWRYAYALEFQPGRWNMPDSVPGDTTYTASAVVEKSKFVAVASADEGTVYKCNFVHADGYANHLNLIDLKEDVASNLGMPKTMSISWSSTSATPWTNKGEEIALLVKPDYDSTFADEWTNDKSLNLFLAPLYLDNTQTNYDVSANGELAYYPIVWAGRYNAGVPNLSATIPTVSYINACEILGQSNPGSYTNDGHGPWTVQRGENAWRYVGQLCPKYVNTSLEKLYSTVPGDSFIDIQPDQYDPSAASGAMGRYLHQYGSIDVNTYVRGNDAKTAYSLYQFSTASATNIRDYFAASASGGGDPEPLGPDDDWLASGVSARCPVNLVARVGNLASAGEVPYLAGDPGYHLEYIDFNSIFGGTYWRTGGTYATNWAPSIAIGNASGDAVIITVESST